MYELSKQFVFDAAHTLDRKIPAAGFMAILIWRR